MTEQLTEMPKALTRRVPLKKQVDVLWDEIASLSAGREDLLEALMETINQSCQVSYVDGRCIVDGMGTSAYEDALKLLVKLDHAKRLDNYRWEIVWPERKGG